MKKVLYILSVVLSLLILSMCLLISCTRPIDAAIQCPTRFDSPIVEKPAMILRWPPHYSQTMSSWSDHPYGSGTISDTGCGLLVYASTISYLERSTKYDPIWVLENTPSILNGEVNDLSLTKSFLETNYDVEVSDIYWTPETVIESLNNGNLVWASVSGELLNRYYTGHLVMLYFIDGDIGLYDPIRPEIRSISEEDFNNTPWVYFYDVIIDKGV